MNRITHRSGVRPFRLLMTMLCLLGLVACSRSPSSPMTPAQFRRIVSMPPDSMPLTPPLSSLPFWTNSIISNVMTYASGKVFHEETRGSIRTVRGKYVIHALDSRLYGQTMYSIMVYDPETSAIKTYSLYGDGHGGDRIVEGRVDFDFVMKTYTCTSTYDDFEETTTGRYTDTEDVSRTVVLKNGAPFLTREVTVRPAGNER